MVRSLSSRKKKMFVLATLSVIVVAGLIIFVFKSLNSPAEGVIANTKTYDSFTKKTATSTKTYSDKYVKFNYPGSYTIQQGIKDSSILSSVDFLSSDHTSKHISVGVIKEDINSDSGVSFRNSHPEIYTVVKKNPQSYIYKKTKDGSEYTGFTQNASFVISISVSSPFSRDLSKDYETIANSLQWR